MKRFVVISALLLCACQAPGPSRYVPDYPDLNPATEPLPREDTELGAALDQYTQLNTTTALQRYLDHHPETPGGGAVRQILALGRRLDELEQGRSRERQLLLKCQEHSRQTEQQAARLQEQLDALAESLIQQEKRLP